MSEYGSQGRSAAAITVDILLVAVTVAILVIALTGGGVGVLFGRRISLRGVDNPVVLLGALVAARYICRRWSPFLGWRRLPLADIDAVALTALQRWCDELTAVSRRQASRTLMVVSLAAFVIKVVIAWTSPGFFSGDDVEVHEMSLRVLWNTNWPVWDLRSAVFPLGVIYPSQWLAHLAGFRDAPNLVFAGRVAVAFLSTVSIGLTAWAAVRIGGSKHYGTGLLAGVLLAVNKLHMAFGSSELPRPVATVFVLAAFICLVSRATAVRSLWAGVLLGIAATLRFSEFIFALPALGVLVLRRDWKNAAIVGITMLAVSMTILGVSDYLYWGSPFHSLNAVTDYTLVKRLSSRGYQFVGWYIFHSAEWINVPTLLLAGFGVWRTRDTAIWAIMPIVALSLLPHKESRYLIPVVPFIAILAAFGMRLFVDWCRSWTERLHPVPVALCLAALFIGVLHDVGHWRLGRTSEDVRFATAVSAVVPAYSIVVAEQAWRMGGHVYLRQYDLRDLDPTALGDAKYLWSNLPPGAAVVLDERSETHDLVSGLFYRGYRKVLAVEGSRFRLWMAPR